MQIRDVKRHNKAIYVFEFESKEEKETYFYNLHGFLDECRTHYDVYDSFIVLINKLEERCSNKYAKEDVVESSFLWQDEIIDWMWCFYHIAMIIYNDEYELLAQQLKELRQSLHSTEKTLTNEEEMSL